MNLTQIKGNTWAIEASELIPLYRLDDSRCVLLDTGLPGSGMSWTTPCAQPG